MHVIICLDARNGVSFNKRRLSSDRVVTQRIIQDADGNVWMNHSSAKLFQEYSVCIDDNFLNLAKEGDTCFVESLECLECLPRIHMITLYRWNRHYPSDVRFPEDLLANWKRISVEEFPGNSHDKITQERYIL